jgi:hypothetical protein
VLMEGLGKSKIFNDFVETRTHNIPACSIVLQPSKLLRAPIENYEECKYDCTP